MIRTRYYVAPPREAYAGMDAQDYTYTRYNYLGSGIISAVKTHHFEAALALTKDHFHRCNVIDYGCADGIFLPSLSRHFDQVLALDKDPRFVRTAERLVTALGLHNVEVRSSEDLAGNVRNENASSGNSRYQIAFLLEIVEHIGVRGALYETKNAFLKQVGSLIAPNGLLVVSVPKMIGIPFLLQRAGLAAFGLHREELSFKDLLKAGVLRETDALEEAWKGEYSHLGFNHRKLERAIARDFTIVRKKHLPFQIVYVLGKRAG